jgi:hypothetical protein
VVLSVPRLAVSKTVENLFECKIWGPNPDLLNVKLRWLDIVNFRCKLFSNSKLGKNFGSSRNLKKNVF